MSQLYICHYAEIGLKGKNRSLFEDKLKHNIKKALQEHLPDHKPYIRTSSKRIIIEFKNEPNKNYVKRALNNIFGIVNFSPAGVIPNDLNIIEDNCINLLKNQTFKTFAIRAKRSSKHVPFTSSDINIKVGAAVVQQLDKKVDLTNPDLTCYIEVLDDKSYIMAERYPGLGGLPSGISGKVLVLLSGGIDSPVAAYYALKRGAHCEFIHFHSFPYTNKRSQEKVIELAQILNKYQAKTRLYMVPFAESQEDIVMYCPDKYRIVLYRRFMMRLAEKMARRKRIRAVVTGESLGQVASQTLANMGVVEDAIKLPVLRPLIGLDKTEIMDSARKIGTYDISIQPHDDACTRFMPRHPVIHAKLPAILEAENVLEIEEMVYRDLKAIEVIEIGN